MKKLLKLLPVLSLLLVGGCNSTSVESDTESVVLSESTITESVIVPSSTSDSSTDTGPVDSTSPVDTSPVDSSSPEPDLYEIPGAFLQGGFRPVGPVDLDFHVALPEGTDISLDITYSELGSSVQTTVEEIAEEGEYIVSATLTVPEKGVSYYDASYTLVDYDDLEDIYEQPEVIQIFWLLDNIRSNYTITWNPLEWYNNDPRTTIRQVWTTADGIAYYLMNRAKTDLDEQGMLTYHTYPTGVAEFEGKVQKWSNTVSQGVDSLRLQNFSGGRAALNKISNIEYASSYDDVQGAWGLIDSGVISDSLYEDTDGNVLVLLSDYQLEDDHAGYVDFLLSGNLSSVIEVAPSGLSQYNSGKAPIASLFISVTEGPEGQPGLLIEPSWYLDVNGSIGWRTLVDIDFVIYDLGVTSFSYDDASKGLKPNQDSIWNRFE
jgi:hypothetical protein